MAAAAFFLQDTVSINDPPDEGRRERVCERGKEGAGGAREGKMEGREGGRGREGGKGREGKHVHGLRLVVVVKRSSDL